MAYQRVTLAQLRTQILDRLGSTQKFWSQDEIDRALNEAVGVWQALTGEKVITVYQTITSTTSNIFDVVTDHTNGTVLSVIRINPSEAEGGGPPV